ncbi:MAG: AI-2E family transporter [Spirochaetes bacterium]|nr:AI-2E family transporter [Spirochaetota bacterium]
MKIDRIATSLLAILTVFATGAVLHLTSQVVLPFITAVLASFVVIPAVDSIQKFLKLPRWIAIAILIILILGVGFLVGVFFYSSVSTLYREMPGYMDKLQVVLKPWIRFLGLPPEATEVPIPQLIGSYIVSLYTRFMDFIAGLILFILFLIFLLLERPYTKTKVLRAFHSRMTTRIFRIFNHTAVQITRFLSIKLLISFGTGLGVLVFFVFYGVDFPILWAVLTFFFNFIPSLGSILVTVITVGFVGLQYYPSMAEAGVVLLFMTVLQQLMGNLVEPKLLGDQLDLSPVVIIFSLLVWGWIWGIAGMFLAVPLTVALKITCENIPYLHPIAILLGSGKKSLGTEEAVSQS